MGSDKAKMFLQRHGLSPEAIDPGIEALEMLREMERGLAGEQSSLPMIPTYLKNEGELKKAEPVAVIDAGGTNYRSALVSFEEGGFSVSGMKKLKMPGSEGSVTWEQFIAFVADSIMPFMDKTDKIGFCFSYAADITPEIDGRVINIDKEVVVTGCSGKLIGASLIAELERRAVFGKKVVILNDTVAVLLGGTAALDREKYSGFIGQVSGTGTNTCCALPVSRIGKLGINADTSVIVNLESGMYDKIALGEFDLELDKQSTNRGEKIFEKMTAGVYLGELSRLMLRKAADEGLLSEKTAQKVRALNKIDSSYIDAWAYGERLEEISEGEEDADFVQSLSRAVFERSARCMCINLLALLRLIEPNREKPVCICAEGSLVQKSRVYRPILEALLEKYAHGDLGQAVEFIVGQETTIPGSAAAAILNA